MLHLAVKQWLLLKNIICSVTTTGSQRPVREKLPHCNLPTPMPVELLLEI